VNVESRGLGSVLEWDTSRGRDFQCIAQLVYCCDGLPEHPLPTAQKLEKWLKRVDNPPTTFMAQINDVLSEFWHIATTPELNFPFTEVDKRVAPVEFVFIGILLYPFKRIFYSPYTPQASSSSSFENTVMKREQMPFYTCVYGYENNFATFATMALWERPYGVTLIVSPVLGG
jgi:hypothetical protein